MLPNLDTDSVGRAQPRDRTVRVRSIAMSLDPRTPVLVGVGQVVTRPDNRVAVSDRPSPLDLMVRALRAAAEDIDGVEEGDRAPIGNRLLAKIDRLCSVSSFVWHTANPSLLVAEQLGISPRDLVVTATGGATPQKLVADGCAAIAAGELDVVAVVGSEAMYSRSVARRDPSVGRLDWVIQDPASTPEARRFGSDRMPLTDCEIARSITMPVTIYPLFENALRHHEGWSLEEHRARLGALWASFSDVASENPYAWITTPMSAENITTATASNRMIAEPYTKLMVANSSVDMGAAFLLCSLEAARAAGVPEDAMVFPVSHAQGDDHWFISQRPELHRSPAIELAGAAALAHGQTSIDEISHVDLYSCFPIAVQMSARALGLDLDDTDRRLTLTGGLTFGGGPGNNYVTHSIASMVTRLRENPGDLGLITGLSYFASSHAVGLYSTTPPRTAFRAFNVQEQVDQLSVQEVDADLTGTVEIETFTISHDRDVGPALGIMAVRNAEGVRGWGTISDPSVLAEISGTELCGHRALLDGEGTITLS